MSKRPAKNLTVNFINTQYACYSEGVPGVTLETVAAQIEYGKYYLYKTEVPDEAAKLASKDADFNQEEYVQFLIDVKAIKEGEPPAFGGERGTTIDSREKAIEVAANPEDEEQVADIMRLAKTISESRKAINKLLAKGVTLGVGFNSGARNKAIAKAKAEAEEEA